MSRATACYYPFPMRWHRNMAQIIADKGDNCGAITCPTTAPTLDKETGEGAASTAPRPDQATAQAGSD